jgi:hypothetical protein
MILIGLYFLLHINYVAALAYVNMYMYVTEMEFLDFKEASFRPDASVGHLCINLNNTIAIGIWHNTFQVQNTNWLWLVNNVVTSFNSDNMHCGCFGQYAIM